MAINKLQMLEFNLKTFHHIWTFDSNISQTSTYTNEIVCSNRCAGRGSACRRRGLRAPDGPARRPQCAGEQCWRRRALGSACRHQGAGHAGHVSRERMRTSDADQGWYMIENRFKNIVFDPFRCNDKRIIYWHYVGIKSLHQDQNCYIICYIINIYWS